MKILCVVGMPNSGKDIISDKAKQLGIFTLTLDEIVREELEISGEIQDQKNRERVFEWLCLNSKELMRRIIDKVTKAKNPDKIVIQGLISPKHIQDIKDRFKGDEVIVMAVHRPPKFRLNIEPIGGKYDKYKIKKMDDFFIEMGLPEVMIMSDYMVVNDKNLEEFRKTVKDKLIDILNIGKER